MKLPPTPKYEARRLVVLQQLGILDTTPEQRFDVITKRAVEIFGVPISTVAFIDKDREWYKSCQCLGVTQGNRNASFCGHAMLSKQVFVVEDTLEDERFVDNPMVVGPPYVRFYAGVALRERNSGLPVGVLCIKDIQPRKFLPKEISLLLQLAEQAENEINS